MKEIPTLIYKENLTEDDIQDVEIAAHMQSKLGHDTKELKDAADSDGFNNPQPIDPFEGITEFNVKDPEHADIGDARKIQSEGFKELLDANDDRYNHLMALKKKYKNEISEFDSLSRLKKKIKLLTNEKGKLTSTPWPLVVSEEEVINAIARNPEELQMFKKNKFLDKITKIFSLGFAHPSWTQHQINIKAKELVGEKVADIEKKEQKYNSEIERIMEFKNNPNWKEFSSMEDLEDELVDKEKQTRQTRSERSQLN